MPKIGEKYVNPFYQQVDGFVRNELNTRASYYGRRVRSAGQSVPKNLLWSYEKVAWGHVISVDYPNIKLGFPGSKVMSDKEGNLTLYSSQRNVPKKPLLTGIEISNEGTMGSLLKGKFTFTVFPVLTSNGFDLGTLEKAFFTPGKEVEVSWGWSVAANNQQACSQQFTGIIYNFNWTFNNDMSITADVSIVSAASIAMGQSGDQSVLKKEEGQEGSDPAGKALNPGQNLIKVIDNDLAQLTGSNILTKGQSKYIGVKDTTSKYLDYIVIGLPFQESADSQTNPNQKTPPVDKTFWYVSLGRIAEFAQKLISDTEFARIYSIQCVNNETDYNKDIKSAYPIDVYFPDNEMGSYGDLQPFPDSGNSQLRTFFNDSGVGSVQENVINIGNILLGVDYVKKTYGEFVVDNATNIPYKNITNFFDTLIKKINVASGDIYQLTPQMYEPRPPSGKINSTAEKIGSTDSPKAILSIEDSNLSKKHTETVIPYKFEGTIFKPLIKNIQISSKPPGPLATAAFVQARDGKATPVNSDVSTSRKSDKELSKFTEEYKKTEDEIKNSVKDAYATGFNDAWSEGYRGNLVKIKKLKTEPNGKNGAHWLNQAIYPVDLSITIDGISGFKFGDVITTTLIPKEYYEKYKMVFTVTKITHSIKDGTWETTLSTKSRISMDGTEGNQNMG
jgi:hypothetical protein